MKCDSCGRDLILTHNDVFISCPFCNKDVCIEKIIRQIVQQHGDDLLFGSSCGGHQLRFSALLADAMKNARKSEQDKIRSALKMEIPYKLYHLKALENNNRIHKMKNIATQLTVSEKTAYELVNCFADAFDFDKIDPPVEKIVKTEQRLKDTEFRFANLIHLNEQEKTINRQLQKQVDELTNIHEQDDDLNRQLQKQVDELTGIHEQDNDLNRQLQRQVDELTNIHEQDDNLKQELQRQIDELTSTNKQDNDLKQDLQRQIDEQKRQITDIILKKKKKYLKTIIVTICLLLLGFLKLISSQNPIIPTTITESIVCNIENGGNCTITSESSKQAEKTSAGTSNKSIPVDASDFAIHLVSTEITTAQNYAIDNAWLENTRRRIAIYEKMQDMEEEIKSSADTVAALKIKLDDYLKNYYEDLEQLRRLNTALVYEAIKKHCDEDLPMRYKPLPKQAENACAKFKLHYETVKDGRVLDRNILKSDLASLNE